VELIDVMPGEIWVNQIDPTEHDPEPSPFAHSPALARPADSVTSTRFWIKSDHAAPRRDQKAGRSSAGPARSPRCD
jgi:hypothetical protein